ncbi:MAG: hypothetical protein GX073_10055 [Firmicutes bacterium]|nr:hypothetical protein [Bacillota bacterium]
MGSFLKRYTLRPDSFLASLLRFLSYCRLPLLITLVLLLLLLFSQLVYTGVGYLFPRVRVVDWGTIEDGQWVDVLVLRSESVLTAPFSGEVCLLVEEGTRVRTGEAIAELVSTEAQSRLGADERMALRTIVHRLYHLEQEVAQIDKDLAFLAKHNRGLAGEKEEERYLSQRKAQLLTVRNQLRKNAAAVCVDWQDCYHLVVADQPGIFSTKLDGGEGFDLLEHAQPKASLARRLTSNRSFNTKVRAGEPWAKLITEYTQTLVCQLPEDVNLEPPAEAVLLVNGKRFKLSFLATDHTNRCWYFTEHTLAPEFLEKRSFSAYLIYSSVTGLRVPTPALAYEEEAGWTVTTSVKGEKRATRVEVVAMNEQWAIVEGLSLGTTVYYR